MTLRLAKMHGAGNDFVVLDRKPMRDAETFVRAISDRRRGIGADGVLFMEKHPAGSQTLFRMHFYNSDGSRSALCLNGSRCVALRAVQLGWAETELSFDTEHERISAQVEREGDDIAQVSLRWRGPRGEVNAVNLPEGSPSDDAWAIDIGDPHLVLEVEAETLAAESFVDRARALRHWAGPSTSGSNVHFVCRTSDHWRIRSFERGVEDETLACGSGCVCSVLALGERDRRITLMTQSGDEIRISAKDDDWCLEGPAVKSFEIDWAIDA